jgi:hypothetical protein
MHSREGMRWCLFEMLLSGFPYSNGRRGPLPSDHTSGFRRHEHTTEDWWTWLCALSMDYKVIDSTKTISTRKLRYLRLIYKPAHLPIRSTWPQQTCTCCFTRTDRKTHTQDGLACSVAGLRSPKRFLCSHSWWRCSSRDIFSTSRSSSEEASPNTE